MPNARLRNIDRWIAGLQLEPDPARRGTLRRLLITEEDRLGVLSQRLEAVDRLIAEAHARIRRQELASAWLAADRPGGGGNGRALANEREILAIVEDYRCMICDALDRVDL